MSVPVREPATFTLVCSLDRIDRESGVTALVDGRAVAVFRTHDDRVFAIANQDPFGRASVLARGIVGTRRVGEEEVPFVASPLHKQAFDLRTGQCLDDPAVRVPAYAVVVRDGTVLVGRPLGERLGEPLGERLDEPLDEPLGEPL